jgi:HSP20 family protein
MTTLVKLKKGRYPWLGGEFSNFFGEDDFFNDRFWHKNVIDTPAINVREIDDYYLVELAAPGLTKKDFEITIDNGYLKIFVEKTSEMEDENNDFTRKEFNYNSFERTLLLPEDIIEEEVKAKYENGILKFKLLKKEMLKEIPSKKIEIE